MRKLNKLTVRDWFALIMALAVVGWIYVLIVLSIYIYQHPPCRIIGC